MHAATAVLVANILDAPSGPNLDFLCVQQSLRSFSYLWKLCKALCWYETLRKEVEYGVMKLLVPFFFFFFLKRKEKMPISANTEAGQIF